MMNEMYAGLDEEITQEEKLKESNITDFEGAKKKRLPYHIWTVGGTDYKMKLTTDKITTLENKYRMNILRLVTMNDIPPLSTMLTIAQAALLPWQHGMKFEKVKGLYDKWVEEGGNQMDFYSRVLIPILSVSGFFTADQTESIMKNLNAADELL